MSATSEAHPTRALRADCGRCSGLCCVAPPFDAVQGFGYDKPAHEPCRHLDAGARCTIHARRAEAGFAGCAAFECWGAGQRVTQQFGGAAWRRSAADAAAMFDAYFVLLRLHELMAMLAAAAERWGAQPALIEQWHALDAHGERGAASAAELPALRERTLALIARCRA
jgi:hypothetical protein